MITIVTALSACATVNKHDLSYTDVRPMEFGGSLLLPGGELQDEQDFQLFFRRADYVLIGEAHTNMADHVSQALILEKMIKKRLKPVIGLEMVDVDNQHVLDRFNNGELSVEQLEKALNWERTVGYSFELYRPIFEVAAQYKIPAYALNIPRQIVREARLKGLDKVADRDRKYLPADLIPVSEAQRAYLLGFFSQHIDQAEPGMFPPIQSRNSDAAAAPSVPPRNIRPEDKSMLEHDAQVRPVLTPEEDARALERRKAIDGFLTAQAIWDSAMAERAASIHKTSKRPVVIIAGQGHVEYSWGIAHRLAVYDQGAKIVTVMPWRAPMETVFMLKQNSPLQDSALPTVFPPADLADIYYYSPLSPLGKAPQGMITGHNSKLHRPQLVVLGVVPDSPAAKAGIMTGDIILQVERREIESSEDFYSLLAQFAAYDTTPTLTLKRGEEKLSIVLPVD